MAAHWTAQLDVIHCHRIVFVRTPSASVIDTSPSGLIDHTAAFSESRAPTRAFGDQYAAMPGLRRYSWPVTFSITAVVVNSGSVRSEARARAIMSSAMISVVMLTRRTPRRGTAKSTRAHSSMSGGPAVKR